MYLDPLHRTELSAQDVEDFYAGEMIRTFETTVDQSYVHPEFTIEGARKLLALTMDIARMDELLHIIDIHIMHN